MLFSTANNEVDPATTKNQVNGNESCHHDQAQDESISNMKVIRVTGSDLTKSLLY